MNQKGFSLVIVLPIVAVIFASVLGFYTGRVYSHQFRQQQPDTTNQPSSGSVSKNNQCEMLGSISPDEYLRTYLVKKGDSLLSIANTQLGSTTRVTELMVLNNALHQEFVNYCGDTTIQAGWKMYLPPKFITHSSGYLLVTKGSVVKSDERSITIKSKNNYVEDYFNQTFAINNKTKLFGVSKINPGDCITTIYDTSQKNKLLGISLQDKKYFLEN